MRCAIASPIPEASCYVKIIDVKQNDARRQRDADFYQRTMKAMDAAKDSNSRDSDIKSLLKDAKDVGSKSLLQKPPGSVGKEGPVMVKDGDIDTTRMFSDDSKPPSAPEEKKQPLEIGKERTYAKPEDDEEEISVAGRKTMKISKGSEKGITGDEKSIKEGESQKKLKDTKPKDTETYEELNAILKKSPSTYLTLSGVPCSPLTVVLNLIFTTVLLVCLSPTDCHSTVIIFSKSYCPYSKRAKKLLLETYKITPAPYVVELDLLTSANKDSESDEPKKFAHPDDEESHLTLGKRLQNVLAANTGRSTVPNILVNGKSIGGSDDIAELDRTGELASKIKSMSGKRITTIEKQGAAAGS